MKLPHTQKTTPLRTFTTLITGAFLSLTPMALGQTSTTHPPGYLSDYRYQVVNLSSMDEAQELMNLETKDTRQKSVCANRAELWTYNMNHTDAVQVGKVFIHFTEYGEADQNKEWSYHVAPYVMVNGEEMVLDAGFGQFHGNPVAIKDWEKYFGKSENCVVLDPTHNPTHLALEQNDMPSDGVTPLTYTKGGARQYPATLGICYVRKVPMYYAYPKDVYAADLALAGNSNYSEFIKTGFDQDEVLFACKQATDLNFKMQHSCPDYLGIHKDPKKESLF